MGNLLESLINSVFYTIPALVVFLTAYFLLKEFFVHENKRRDVDFRLEKLRTTLPLRLQAYERIIMLLERISPANLVMRLHQPGMSGVEFQKLLVQTIRDEFSHNLSQQLFVSKGAWELVKAAKEEMIRQINISATQISDNATSVELSNKLLEMSVEKMATRRAIDFLKEELKTNFE
jgi:hypothetical protein